MIKELEALKAEERELMMDAISLVTLLVAGADGKIDSRETEWATKITKIRGYKEKAELKPFTAKSERHLRKGYNITWTSYLKMKLKCTSSSVTNWLNSTIFYPRSIVGMLNCIMKVY